MSETSTKPYLIRAIYEWCTDNGFTPYIAVFVDNSTNVPREFVKNDEIVLNVSFDATSQLDMGNEWITFHARFSGVSRKIEVPINNVLAVYARENGQGMAFPVERSMPPAQAATERENSPPPSCRRWSPNPCRHLPLLKPRAAQTTSPHRPTCHASVASLR